MERSLGADSLLLLCILLFVDGATFAFFTTPLLLQFGKLHPPWQVALAGGAASALGSVVQLVLLKWGLSSEHRWMKRFAPSRDKLTAATQQYPSASFLALLVARATPLPDAPLKLAAAVVGYPSLLYGLALFLGALPYYFLLALVGSKVHIPGWVLIAAAAAIVLGALVDFWRRRRKEAT
jgi:membrane protein YqaA with SNARE-associated domain